MLDDYITSKSEDQVPQHESSISVFIFTTLYIRSYVLQSAMYFFKDISHVIVAQYLIPKPMHCLLDKKRIRDGANIWSLIGIRPFLPFCRILKTS